MIAAERERLRVETDDAWEAALATAIEDLNHEDWRARRAAADFLARVGGRYQDKGAPVAPVFVIDAAGMGVLREITGSRHERVALTEGVARLMDGA